jgi:hypothetical protein
MATTVLNLQTALQERLQDISDVPDATLIRWADFLNKWAYREMIRVDSERFMSTQDYTVSTSPTSQALPTDFRDISSYESGFFYYNATGQLTGERLPRTGPGAWISGFWISGGNVNFTGINTSTTFQLRYIPTVATIDSLSDTFSVPDEYLEYMLEAMVKLYFIWDEFPEYEALTDQRFANFLSDMLANLRKEPKVYDIYCYNYSA